MKQDHSDIQHILAILNALSRNILSESVPLVKSLKSYEPCHVEKIIYLVRLVNIS